MTTTDDKQRKMAERVTKLLTLAADPRTPIEERQSAFARAADLMTRYGIGEAMIRQQRGDGPEPIETYRYETTNKGGFGKVRTLAAGRIARELGCRCAYFYIGQRTPYVAIIGAASDIATARALIPLVMTQAEHAAGPAARDHANQVRRELLYPDDNAVRRARTQFYRSFLLGFGTAVADRVRERRQRLTDDPSTAPHGAALVLATRADRVAAEFARQFPKLGNVRKIEHSREGLRAGHQHGRRAHLGDDGLTPGDRPALPH